MHVVAIHGGWVGPCIFWLGHFGDFIAGPFTLLRYFDHLSRSCIKTRCNCIHQPIFSDNLPKMTIIFFGHLKKISVCDRKIPECDLLLLHSGRYDLSVH